MRRISVAITKKQIRAKIKTVTRRNGWWNLKAGEVLMTAEKCQGLKKGEKVVDICLIRIIDTRPEPLRAMTDNLDYGFEECKLEGFPDLSPGEFVNMFCVSHKGCTPETTINRIEFEYI